MTRLVAEGVWLCADVLEVDTLRAGALIVSVIRNGLSDAGQVCAFRPGCPDLQPSERARSFDVGRVDAWELGCRLPVVPVALQPTQHAGHAPELTRVSAATGRPLIVTVSGDGIYNEVVNGIFDVSLTGALADNRLVGTPTTIGAVPTGCH